MKRIPVVFCERLFSSLDVFISFCLLVPVCPCFKDAHMHMKWYFCECNESHRRRSYSLILPWILSHVAHRVESNSQFLEYLSKIKTFYKLNQITQMEIVVCEKESSGKKKEKRSVTSLWLAHPVVQRSGFSSNYPCILHILLSPI